MELSTIFSKRLTEAVVQSGTTYAALAQKLGVNKSTVSMYIHEKALPSLATLCMIADILEVSTDFLLGRTEY